jgi:Zn-dependent protease
MDTAEFLRLGFLYYLVFVFSLTLHEAAHALVAKWLGDLTAYEGGQVTLNPLPHIQREPFGMVAAPLVSYVLGGWMLGWASIPCDPGWAWRHPHRAAVMSAAGPLANLALAIFAGLAIRWGIALAWFMIPERLSFHMIVEVLNPSMENVATVLSLMFMLNVMLFVFNLLPLPPLDGSSVITLLMSSDRARRWQDMLREHDYLPFFGIVLAWQGMRYIYPAFQVLFVTLLYPEGRWVVGGR